MRAENRENFSADQLKKIQKSLNNLEEKVDYLVRLVGNQYGHKMKPSNFPKIPAGTIGTFQEWEQFLNNVNHFNFAAFYLKQEASSQDLKSCIRNLMRNIMTNRLAEEFNWGGHNDKHAFQKTNLCYP